MQIAFIIMFILSGMMVLSGWIAILLRSSFVGLLLLFSAVVAVGLALWAAMYSDPPSLLPLWAWLVGVTITPVVILGWKARKT
jgi:hypothetical protein